MSKYMGQIMAECDCQHQACEMRGYCMAARIEQLELAVRYEADLAQQALDAREKLEAKLAWRPIETAPRDGVTITQRVLVFCPPYGAGSANWTGERWNCHFCLNREAQPTHWRPLPDEPAELKGQEDD